MSEASVRTAGHCTLHCTELLRRTYQRRARQRSTRLGTGQTCIEQFLDAQDRNKKKIDIFYPYATLIKSTIFLPPKSKSLKFAAVFKG